MPLYQSQTSSAVLDRILADHRPHTYNGYLQQQQSPDDTSSPNDTQAAGVGLVFKRDGFERNVVFSLVKDSPADEVGIITVGDILLRVDGELTTGMSLQTLRSKITGTPGTAVSLTFQRANAKTEVQYHVDLVRGIMEIKKGNERTIEELNDELIKVREQAVEETKARAKEEIKRKETETALRKAERETVELEDQVKFMMEELIKAKEELQRATLDHDRELQQSQHWKETLEEQLYQEDAKRTAAEFQLRKSQRNAMCGFFGLP